MVQRFRENRKVVRRSMRRHATVLFNAVGEPINCTIFDLSGHGARLSVAHPLSAIPHSFTLSLFRDGSLERDCEIVWRDSRYIGIKFTSEWHTSHRVQSRDGPEANTSARGHANAG
jgi:hypothetical protein